MTEARPAVFLDRDGTIIEDVGVVARPEQVRWIPGAVDAMGRLQDAGFALVVVTNQEGISRGLVSARDVARVHDAMDAVLQERGVRVDAWYVCPHRKEEGCGCRKPADGHLVRARDALGIDPARSFVVGDHVSDVLFGNRHGVTGLYVLTGHGGHHLDRVPPDALVFHDVVQAADWVVAAGDMARFWRRVEEAAAALAAGELVAFPTETVYGLGARADDAEAVRRIFEVKGRPAFNPLIVHVADVAQVEAVAARIPPAAAALMEAFWPGPLTVVLPRGRHIPPVVTGGNETVAVRMPAHPVARRLLAEAAVPVAAPSANLFGRTSATTAQHVRDQLGDQVAWIVDGGACRVGLESTVLSLVEDPPTVLRLGAVTRSDVEQIIGPVRLGSGVDAVAPHSPGMLRGHYAPRTPLFLVEDVAAYAADPQVGILSFAPVPDAAGPVEILSGSGDEREAASRLYAALSRLDASGVRRIVAQPAPSTELGAAINDRLQRAAHGSRHR